MKKKTQKRKMNLIWSEISRNLRQLFPNCEWCGSSDHLNVHHIISKFYNKSLFRFSEENLIVLCAKCHFKFHKNPVETMEFFKKYRPEDYKYLLQELEYYKTLNNL